MAVQFIYNASTMDKKTRYKQFLEKVLEDLRNRRPGVGWKIVEHHPGWSFAAFHRVKYRIWYAAGFSGGNLRVDLHIGHNDPSMNQWLFDQLFSRQRIIEDALGFELNWETPFALRTKAGRIAVYQHGTIDEEPWRLAELRAWAVDMIISLRTALTSHLHELLQ